MVLNLALAYYRTCRSPRLAVSIPRQCSSINALSCNGRTIIRYHQLCARRGILISKVSEHLSGTASIWQVSTFLNTRDSIVANRPRRNGLCRWFAYCVPIIRRTVESVTSRRADRIAQHKAKKRAGRWLRSSFLEWLAYVIQIWADADDEESCPCSCGRWKAFECSAHERGAKL